MRSVSMLISVTLVGWVACLAAQTRPSSTGVARKAHSPGWEQCHEYLGQPPETILSACSELILSGSETREDLEKAYIARGDAYYVRADYKQALADFDQAIQIDPFDWRAFLSQGRAYRGSGALDNAISSFNRALELGKDINSPTILADRAKTYWMAGEESNAEGDFNRVISFYSKMNPKHVMLSSLYVSRGLFYLSSGRFALAESDFAAVSNLKLQWDELDETVDLYRYLARIHANQEGIALVETDAKKYDLKKWPGPLVKFCLGQAKTADVLAEVYNTNAIADRSQRAQAYFLFGETASARGNAAEATSWFERARETGYVSSDEYIATGMELKRLASVRGLVPQPALAASLPNGKYYALVIGIDHYTAPMNELKTAVRDATAMGKVLREKYGFEVTSLLDRDATHDNILDAITGYQDTLGPNDNLLIYYAGHGEGVRNADGTYSKAYWLPVDAASARSSRRIIGEDLTTDIREMPARHVLIIADSCYAGGLTRSARNAVRPSKEPPYLAKMLAARSRTLMASGGEEPVDDGGPDGHSVFAAAVLRALEGSNEQMFSANRLFVDEIQPPVMGNARQSPQYSFIRDSGHDNGDFVFVRRR